ncbi:MAG: transglycosylase SLT domain-containing protein [Gemmatimonadota bacterium]
MQRRLRQVLIAAVLGAVILLIAALGRRGDGAIETSVPGDVQAEVGAMAEGDMPARARAFLATDRPWRAARVMREYGERGEELTDDERVLAARAEAAWGAWPRARALLEGVSALDTHEHGIGLYLLARARDQEGDVTDAVEAYRAFLALSPPAGTMEEERAAATLRLGLALLRAGEPASARPELERSAQRAGAAAVWLELLEADAIAQTGDTAAVRQAVAPFDSGARGLRAWRARVAAAMHAGDLPGARALANRARAWAGTNTTRAEFLVAAGRIAVEMGDIEAGRDAMRAAIDLTNSGAYARQAADVLRGGDTTAAEALAIARVDAAQGLHEQAVDGFRRWLEAGLGSATERAEGHMEHANALFYAERYDQVELALQPIAGSTSAQLLMARAESHRGNEDEAVRIYLRLAQRFPGTGTGVHALFLAAGTRHDENDFDRARELYQRVVDQYPGRDQMGLAMMRLAGIAFLQQDYAAAARIWDAYRSRYPGGTRALQATYWAGRARQEMGDEDAATILFRSVLQRQRDSYYALLASQRLDEPFWPLPMRPAPAASSVAADRVAGWMQGVDLLRNAGFAEEAAAEAARITASAGSDRQTLYALGEALAARGYSRNAIQVGLRLQGAGAVDRRLLRILYPFPYRTLITEEARDRDLDPFVAAALIRQESMFEARITSPAGARGLMQIMPATGAQVAEAAGIAEWEPESLYHPEINVHLGTRYVAQHMTNYDGSLPSVFSAYNAGPHRVEWWSEFEEYGEDEIFTERIPYRETRDYVKILTRNRALYRGLYGSGE